MFPILFISIVISSAGIYSYFSNSAMEKTTIAITTDIFNIKELKSMTKLDKGYDIKNIIVSIDEAKSNLSVLNYGAGCLSRGHNRKRKLLYGRN